MSLITILLGFLSFILILCFINAINNSKGIKETITTLFQGAILLFASFVFSAIVYSLVIIAPIELVTRKEKIENGVKTYSVPTWVWSDQKPWVTELMKAVIRNQDK